jgi:hypothetical protein
VENAFKYIFHEDNEYDPDFEDLKQTRKSINAHIEKVYEFTVIYNFNFSLVKVHILYN